MTAAHGPVGRPPAAAQPGGVSPKRNPGVPIRSDIGRYHEVGYVIL